MFELDSYICNIAFKHMKIKFILFLIIVSHLNLKGQEGLPFYQHYLLSDSYLINPSYAGATSDVLKLRGTHYSQWAGLEDAPSTQTLSAHSRVSRRLATGFYVFNDKNGAASIRGFNLSAAYHIPITDEYGYEGEDVDKFSFGLSYQGLSQVFDRSKWNPEHQNDPLLQSNSFYLNYFNLGVSFNYKGGYGAVSVLDIPLGDNAHVVNAVEPMPTYYYFLAGYKFEIAKGIQLEPSFLMNLNSNSERQMDLTLRSKFALGYNAFGFGVNYRVSVDKTGSQTLSLAPMVNLEIGKMRIGYAYSAGMSDIAKEFGDGHLISFGFDLGNPFR